MVDQKWYSAGTISVTNGGRGVVGSATAWNPTVKSGDTLYVKSYALEVLTVEDDNHLTLADDYPGPTEPGLSYSVSRTSVLWHSPAILAAAISTLIASYKRATSIVLFEGVPAATLGNEGWAGFDLLSFDFYVKENGAWSKKGSTHGSVWYNGTTDPAGSLGLNNDFYVLTASTANNTASDIFKKVGANWVKVGSLRGARGATWLSGAADPAATLGENEDFYLQTGWGATGIPGDVWRKASGTWSVLVNTAGAEWYSGPSDPPNFTGVTGDFYFQSAKGTNGLPGDIWRKTGMSTWTKMVNTIGVSWYSGPTVPLSSLGNNDDLYMQTADEGVGVRGDLWKKIAGAWVKQFGFRPTLWLAGATVPAAAQGADGDFYYRGTGPNSVEIYLKQAGAWVLQSTLVSEERAKSIARNFAIVFG